MVISASTTIGASTFLIKSANLRRGKKEEEVEMVTIKLMTDST